MRKTKLSPQEVAQINAANLRKTRDGGYGRVRDYSGNQHKVEILWNLNEQAKRDQIFELRIGGKRALIDLEELQKLTRWV